MGLLDLLRQGSQSGRALPREELEKLYQSFGSPDALNSAVGVARGEAPGAVDPRLQRPVGEISQIDRYTDTRRMNPAAGALYAGLLAPAWEAYKASVQAGLPETKTISKLLGQRFVPPELQQFSVGGPGGQTSPASLANITSPLYGVLSRLLQNQRRGADVGNIHPLPRR